MVWLYNPDPASPYGRGSGTAQALNDELNTDESAAKTINSYFQHGAISPLLIYGAGLNAEGTKSLEENWQNEQAGFFNAYKPLFLNRKVEIKELQQNLASREFIELRQYERDTIIQVFGIPPEILGILQNSNRATIEAADLFFSRYTLLPRLEMLREQFQKQIVKHFDDSGLIEIDFVSPVTADKSYQLSVMQAMPHAFTYDEVRIRAGEDILPEGRGDVFPIPSGITLTRIEELQPSPEFVLPEPVEEIPTETEEVPLEPYEIMPLEQQPLSPSLYQLRRNKKLVMTGKGYMLRRRR
jgi:hypothetical protein